MGAANDDDRTWMAPSGTSPAAAHTTRYPATNAAVGKPPWPRERVTEACASTIGTTDGNIIATIITSQVTRNNPASIMATPPMPIDAACPIVSTHAAAAHATRTPTMAPATGRGSAETRCWACTRARSAGPVERRRERALARVLELHAESFDARAGRPRDREGRVGRVRDAGEPGRLGGAFRREFLDLDGDLAADPDVVAPAVVLVVDRKSFDAEDLAYQRGDVR